MNLTGNDYWDSALENRDFEHSEVNYPSPELAALAGARTLKKAAKILDVGCGGGLDAIFLAQSGFYVIGVDISSPALRIAERRAEEANVEVGRDGWKNRCSKGRENKTKVAFLGSKISPRCDLAFHILSILMSKLLINMYSL